MLPILLVHPVSEIHLKGCNSCKYGIIRMQEQSGKQILIQEERILMKIRNNITNQP